MAKRWSTLRRGTLGLSKGFDPVVLKAVDESLAVLGETAKGAVCYHLERSFQIRREEIPEKLEAFREALSALLGDGARVVERLIARNLYGRLGLDFEEQKNWTLVDYVNNAAKAKRGQRGRVNFNR